MKNKNQYLNISTKITLTITTNLVGQNGDKSGSVLISLNSLRRFGESRMKLIISFTIPITFLTIVTSSSESCTLKLKQWAEQCTKRARGSISRIHFVVQLFYR